MPTNNRPTEDESQEKVLYDILQYNPQKCGREEKIMRKKYKLYIIMAMCMVICGFLLNKIAFFKDKEFERAVRDTKYTYRMSFIDKRDKPIIGIIWKKDLEKLEDVSIDFRKYKVKDVSDLKKFKNLKQLMLCYSHEYEGDTSIYEDEHVLDNIYKIKNFKKLEWIFIGHLKVNEDIKAMFPNAKVFIDQRVYGIAGEKSKILMTQQGGRKNDKKEKRKSYRWNYPEDFQYHDSKGI